MVRFSFLAVVFFLYVAFSFSSATNIVDVQAICKKAKNPSFCLNLLKSKPGGGAGGDLVSLASYTIGVLRTDVSNTITFVTKLIAQSGNDPKTQNHYKNCLSHFGMDEGALGEVTEALQLLKNFDYNGVNVHMSSVMTDVDDCLLGDSSPIKDSSLLLKYVDVVNQVAQIILIISNMLQF